MLNRSLLIGGHNGCQVVKKQASLVSGATSTSGTSLGGPKLSSPLQLVSRSSSGSSSGSSSSSSGSGSSRSRLLSTTTAIKTNRLARQAKPATAAAAAASEQHRDNELECDPAQIGANNKARQQRTTKSLVSKEMREARLQHLELWHSVDLIKRLGHRMAHLDPLNLRGPETLVESLDWSHPLVEQMRANRDIVATKGFLDTKQPLMAVNELIEAVLSIYTGSDCGLEFAHLSNQEEVEWLTSNWEKLNEMFHLDSVEQENLAKLLLECEAFDHFMATKFPTTKRYGCEGAESMLVVFDEILRLCHLGDADMDEMTCSIGRIDDVIIGLPHRGRLNLLTCLLGLEPAVVFNKTRGESELDLRAAWMAKGDVLSHLSTNMRFVYGTDRHHIGLSRDTPQPINVTLLPNPSHLEVSAPMVNGAARGRAHNLYHRYSSSPKFAPLKRSQQHRWQKESAADSQSNSLLENYTQLARTILPVQVHGDAALAGQGIIQETLQMAHLPMFSVGGSLHLVVNNQIGYTTEGSTGRSSRYCTDILKLIEAPIIHVNGQNISGVIRATRLALAYRQRFGKDVAIDLICYRQHGHNEIDEPSFTQPIMYDAIRRRQSIPQLYCDSIGLNKEQRSQIVDDLKNRLKDSTKRLDSLKADNDNYRNFSLPTEYHRDHICSWKTGCDLSLLKSVALASVETPENFNVHPNLERHLIKDRRQKFHCPSGDSAQNLAQIQVDWASGEILALGSLLKQNNSVRIAGQDVARGTFSTRHAVLFDQKSGQPYIPLNNMIDSRVQEDKENHDAAAGDASESQSTESSPLSILRGPQLEVANTILSEEAAIAYEFAYSAETCNLTIWEAQFGDFFNTAQSVIDTLVSSSESKWLKQSPLTLLLPHGLDGAGPEHSSSHLERFLQMSSSSFDSIDTEAKVNWSVCFPTLPSQYFHLLRRQVLRPFRKPLVVMSPKMIFRHPDCVSNLADFGPDKSFEPVLNDPTVEDTNSISTIVLCSGKIFFQLKAEKLRYNLDNVAIIRLEELCPFPIQSLIQTIKQYPNVRPDNFVWFQEEHKNQGAYSFVDTRFSNMAGIKLNYIGRPESELPATGILALHKKEHEKIMKQFQALKRM